MTPESPIARFLDWQREAREAGDPQWNLLALATLGPGGYPAVRMMTLWQVRPDGFVLTISDTRPKARQIREHPQVGLLAFWPTLRRQVRVTGVPYRLPEADSDAFWVIRPVESRVMDWVVLEDREEVIPDLDAVRARAAQVRAHLREDPPRPRGWALWVVKPVSVELWQQGEARLHDRTRFVWEKGAWREERLLP